MKTNFIVAVFGIPSKYDTKPRNHKGRLINSAIEMRKGRKEGRKGGRKGGRKVGKQMSAIW